MVQQCHTEFRVYLCHFYSTRTLFYLVNLPCWHCILRNMDLRTPSSEEKENGASKRILQAATLSRPLPCPDSQLDRAVFTVDHLPNSSSFCCSRR